MPALESLRMQVREFVAERLAAGAFEPRCDCWQAGFDPDFSRSLGARGWLGMTWPREYGGGGHSELARLTVNEELLAAGAPVAAHWFADRQVGPSLLRYGSEAQRQRYLPAMARGELYVAIGLSEPDAGSDLAAVRSTATRDGDGWTINGRKVWTSHATRCHIVVALVRTAPRDPDRRHDGLSQFIVDLTAPGVTVRPIELLDGSPHFAEVILDGVRVGPESLLGNEGDGWRQVTSELAYERSGPERFLSTMPLLTALIAGLAQVPPEVIGTLAELVTLRQLSRQVADLLAQGIAPVVAAALVKESGTRFESSVIEVARRYRPVDADPAAADRFERLYTQAVLHGPVFTLRGGTNEILRTIVATSLAAG
jgi:hypothetical protein